MNHKSIASIAVAAIAFAACEQPPCPPCPYPCVSIPSPTPPMLPVPFPTTTPEAPVKNAAAGHEPKPNTVVRPTPTPSVAAIVGIQATRWNQATLKSSWQISLDKAVMSFLKNRDRYESVAKIRDDGTPAAVIFALHYRESSNSFNSHLHEGSSLLHRTRYVPRGRLRPPKEPPYSWEQSANDALYACDDQLCDHMNGPWSDLTWSLDKIERYNGWGYRRMGVPSPYLWSGTSAYRQGKYTSDGHYSTSAIDQQLGVCAILKRMKEKGIDLRFDR